MTIKNKQMLLMIAIVMFASSFLMPKIEFQGLAYMQGPIVKIEEKKTAGFTVKVAEKNTIKIFNIPNSTIATNEKIRNLTAGSPIEVWYDSRYKMSKGSYDAWQVSHKGAVLIRYEDELKTINLYKNIFMLSSLLVFVFYLISIALTRRK